MSERTEIGRHTEFTLDFKSTIPDTRYPPLYSVTFCYPKGGRRAIECLFSSLGAALTYAQTRCDQTRPTGTEVLTYFYDHGGRCLYEVGVCNNEGDRFFYPEYPFFSIREETVYVERNAIK